MSGFRSSVWDPLLIVSQIASCQCLFWVTLGCWVYILSFLLGSYSSLNQLFDYEELLFKELEGKLLLVAYLLNSLTGAMGLWYVVKRTKQCWDFAMTAHVLHALLCTVYAGVPTSALWWFVQFLSIVIMTVVGEFLCMRTELQAIPLSMGPKADL